jgi:hypothetical protein
MDCSSQMTPVQGPGPLGASALLRDHGDLSTAHRLHRHVPAYRAAVVAVVALAVSVVAASAS